MFLTQNLKKGSLHRNDPYYSSLSEKLSADKQLKNSTLNILLNQKKTQNDEISESTTESTNVGNKAIPYCGRIRFDYVGLGNGAPTDLICEECEQSYSTIRCDACDQVFCVRCADLCHQMLDLAQQGVSRHPHEVEKKIRAVALGDISKVTRSDSYFPPEYDLTENELEVVKDLTVPNSLATNQHMNENKKITIENTSKFYSMPLYDVGDTVCFIDPVTNCESYGKILSEWDYRHGDVAPTLIRGGDGTEVQYVLELLGQMNTIKSYSSLVVNKSVTKEDFSMSFPVLEDIVNVPLRFETKLAQSVNLKIESVQQLQKYGPRHHYRPTEDPQSYKTDFTSKSYPRVDDTIVNDDSPVLDLPLYSSSQSKHPSGYVISEMAAKRRLIDALGSVNDKDPATLARYLNVIILPETELCRPGDQQYLLRHSKFNKIRSFLMHRLTSIVVDRMRSAWQLWLLWVLKGREFDRQEATLIIQSCFRRWRCRHILGNLAREWSNELYERWARVHRGFSYSDQRNLSSVTVDNKKYFRTKKDANYYFSVVRVALSKCMMYLMRKRVALLRAAIGLWKDTVQDFLESNLRTGHWDPIAIDKEEEEGGVGRHGSRKDSLQELHSEVRSSIRNGRGLRGIGVADTDDVYENVAALPLALGRVAEEDIPPAAPCDGIPLPPLPVLPATQGIDGTPVMPVELKPKFNSYRAKMQGPTDDSCWIIPGVLAMGKVPLGRGRWKKRMGKGGGTPTTATDALSLLLLAGIGSFVSFMDEEEERLVTQTANLPSVESVLSNSSNSSKSALKNAIFQLKYSRDSDQARLDFLCWEETSGNGSRSNTADPRRQKEKSRLKSKIVIAQQSLDKATEELNEMANSLSWERYSLSSEFAPSKHELLPILWEIERKLAKGEVVYVYSKEGHARCSLVCGCLLGRLYALSPAETLFRLQTHHDSYPSLVGREIPISCMQLRGQQQVLVQVLRDSNRVYEASYMRSQPDPESYGKCWKSTLPERRVKKLNNKLRVAGIDLLPTETSTAAEENGGEMSPSSPQSTQYKRAIYPGYNLSSDPSLQFTGTPGIVGRGEEGMAHFRRILPRKGNSFDEVVAVNRVVVAECPKLPLIRTR